MTALRAAGGDRVVDRRLAGGRPVLGICVGMQVMFDRGVERDVDVAGLGEWPGTVDRIESDVLPHMGWNTVDVPEGSALFAGLEEERFYFVHSYAARTWGIDPLPPLPAPRVTWATHGERFVAAVENGPLSATQFHPRSRARPGSGCSRTGSALSAPPDASHPPPCAASRMPEPHRWKAP
ncbi:Imidazole glycerol phosphate synthase subunit HisH [Clavibacter michiganensis subsp. michiganensis]|uniref:Imidazole glycerol phosphate synthase subunit HisH n=1 Tax=Clavibacter michiganensis subsp. michiganensis TaxID=33013 RepID=A0A251XHY7_CLAMM|nr:Imidazole glycerol phosphate synthase subunit HisH [Clavibacter michiganensis subsp. michiganensis]OUE02402.1 Imidazole glycerol phosphate synthase subunit HisH [Clavibacter michiganensis subsp. michiganensis]